MGKKVDYRAFKFLKKSQLSDSLFFPFCVGKGRYIIGVLTPEHWATVDPIRYSSQQLDSETWGYPPCLRAIKIIAFLVNTTEKIIIESPLNIFVSQEVDVIMNSHHR